jgi:iron(III) transport system substrate-binding protein
MRTVAGALAAVILALSVAACVTPPATGSLGMGQTPPGTLKILGSAEDEYVRGMSRAFELETGIRTQYERMPQGEALDLLREQRDTPEFSVWWGGSAEGYIAANAEGLIEPYKPRGSGKIPTRYKDADGAWTGIWVGVLAFAVVNPSAFAEKGVPEPASWADLANPVYRGRITVGHPASTGTGYTVLATIVQLNDRDVNKSFTYLEALHKNLLGGEYLPSSEDTPKLVPQNEPLVAIAFAHDIVAASQDGTVDVKIVYPAEGTGYEIGGMALVKGAPESDLGKRFMDWALTEKAQELGPLFTAYQIPTNPDAKVPRKSARLTAIKTIDYDFRWSGLSRQTLVARYNRTIAPPPRLVGSSRTTGG